MVGMGRKMKLAVFLSIMQEEEAAGDKPMILTPVPGDRGEEVEGKIKQERPLLEQPIEEAEGAGHGEGREAEAAKRAGLELLL